MNFRNSEPPANFKTARISALTDGTETNNLMGSDLVSEASAMLKEAETSFDSLAEMNGNMGEYNGNFDTEIQKNQVKISVLKVIPSLGVLLCFLPIYTSHNSSSCLTNVFL